MTVWKSDHDGNWADLLAAAAADQAQSKPRKRRWPDHISVMQKSTRNESNGAAFPTAYEGTSTR